MWRGGMAPLIIGRPDQKGSTGRANRMFVERVLGIVRTGLALAWSSRGLWGIGTACFDASADGASRVFGVGSSRRSPMIRTSKIQLSIYFSGASARRRGEKGGLKIRRKIKRSAARAGGSEHQEQHMAVRGLGCPVRFTLTAGQKGDAPQAAAGGCLCHLACEIRCRPSLVRTMPPRISSRSRYP